MKRTKDQLVKEYADILTSLLSGAGEAGLQRGYELGREAIEEHLGPLELVEIYNKALAQTLKNVSPDGVVTMATAAELLATTLAPFEMTHRGYQESISKLQQQATELTNVSKFKSEFLANMSHELRTPLNAIIGFVSLMYKEKVGRISPAQKEYLGNVLTSSRHLLQLINDVLDLAKVESGKFEFHPELIDLTKLVGEVRDILRGLAAEKQLRVEIQISPELTTVVLDPAKLKQLLYNYLSNAIKFTPEGGQVTIRLSSLKHDMFQLDVEDTGIGIKPEDLKRLFVEFQQISSGTSKKYSGTGLGLALTKRLVEAQGGRVSVSSTPGKGTTFSAVLPKR